jgi:hypothetical protein
MKTATKKNTKPVAVATAAASTSTRKVRFTYAHSATVLNIVSKVAKVGVATPWSKIQDAVSVEISVGNWDMIRKVLADSGKFQKSAGKVEAWTQSKKAVKADTTAAAVKPPRVTTATTDTKPPRTTPATTSGKPKSVLNKKHGAKVEAVLTAFITTAKKVSAREITAELKKHFAAPLDTTLVKGFVATMLADGSIAKKTTDAGVVYVIPRSSVAAKKQTTTAAVAPKPAKKVAAPAAKKAAVINGKPNLRRAA